MADTWLIIDVSCLVYRSYHVMGDLSFEGVKTGAIFGFFRDILDLQEIFSTNKIVFCFDVGQPLRRELFPAYKSSRRKAREESTEDEKLAFSELHNQLTRIRTKYLPYIGFRNLLWQEGYEADDVIASVCKTLTDGSWVDRKKDRDSVVVVSSDSDMLQLLRIPEVVVWNPRTRKPVTAESFREKYDIGPALWSSVKAIGGCSSDDIPGVPGVGEKTAIKFLRSRIKPESKAYKSIVEHNAEVRLYRRLTKLPFKGTDTFELRPDKVTRKRWEKALEKLGMDSLRGRAVGVKKR